jgi:hypothetical protein
MAGSSESCLNLKPPLSSTCVNICVLQVIPVLMPSRCGFCRSVTDFRADNGPGGLPFNFASQTRTACAGVVRTFADDAIERDGASRSVLGVRAGVCSTGPFPDNLSMRRSQCSSRASLFMVSVFSSLAFASCDLAVGEFRLMRARKSKHN